MNNEKAIHWSQLQQVSNKPTLRMLLEEGCVISQKCLLKGEQRGSGGKYRDILFDKEYVHYWLIKFFETFYPNNTKPFKVLISFILITLVEYLKEEVKIYKLHGHHVIKLSDLGITYTESKLKSELDSDE